MVNNELAYPLITPEGLLSEGKNCNKGIVLTDSKVLNMTWNIYIMGSTFKTRTSFCLFVYLSSALMQQKITPTDCTDF